MNEIQKADQAADLDGVISSLLRSFSGELSGCPGFTAIHAGHFMLFPSKTGCVPSVNTWADADGVDEYDPYRDALKRFAIDTWQIGAAFAATLKQGGDDARLLTLVNDWLHVRDTVIPNASALRSRFYESNRKLFPSYKNVLGEYHLDETDVVAIGEWYPFISESWLRRRVERHLKRQFKSENPSLGLTLEESVDGQRCLVFDDYGRALKLLVCGQADCAGEVMELVYLLQEMGCKQLINIVPAECEKPVNEGTRRAIAVFRLAEFSAINIAISCLGPPIARVSRVFGDEVGENEIEAIVEPVGFSYR